MRIACWLVLPLLLAAAAPSRAGEDLNKAEKLFEDMEYAKAHKAAERVLASALSGPAELVAAYRIQGLCLSMAGKTAEALLAFRRLLSIDPGFELSQNLSPKLTAPFYQAVAMSKNFKPIALAHQPPEPGEVLGGTTLKVMLASDPMGLVSDVRLRFKAGATGAVQELVQKVAKPRDLLVMLPSGLKARELSYWFEALNSAGGVLAGVGDPDRPFALHVKVKAAPVAVAAGGAKTGPVLVPPPDTGAKTAARSPAPEPARQGGDEEKDRPAGAVWYKTWWFWTAVGVVVAGAATGTALGLTMGGGTNSGPVDYGIRVR